MKVSRLALVLATAVALAGARARAEADAPAAHVVRASGSVEFSLIGKPGWRPAHQGLALAAGSSLRTGDDGRAEVSLASGTVRVYENSLLRVPGAEGGNESVRLRKGAGLFDVKLQKGKQFRVETPEAVAAVKGTRFLVEAGKGAVATGVFEGVVEMRKLGEGAAPPVLVRAGFGALLGDDVFELMVLEREDPWQEWESGAPAPALSPSSPTAQNEGGEGSDPARQVARDAVLEATDAALETDLGVEDPKRDDAVPADQDEFEAAIETIDRETAADITRGSEIERPEKPERIDIDNSGRGSVNGSSSSGPGNGSSDDDD